jgi:hypothetical protein
MADSVVDIWGEQDQLEAGSSTRPGTPGAESGFMTPAHSASASGVQLHQQTTGMPVGQIRTRVPHGVPGETIEMTSAPVSRRQI